MDDRRRKIAQDDMKRGQLYNGAQALTEAILALVVNAGAMNTYTMLTCLMNAAGVAYADSHPDVSERDDVEIAEALGGLFTRVVRTRRDDNVARSALDRPLGEPSSA